jgi:hypothetical protein
MTSTETHLFRDTILLTARNFPRGITRQSLDVCLRSAGFHDFSFRDLDFHLDYLRGKKLLENPSKHHTPELQLWKLSAEGVDDLAMRNL